MPRGNLQSADGAGGVRHAELGANQSNQVNGQGVKRAPSIESYEADLAKARRWARIISSLNAISQFLAFCNLTWATVALLGAFLPDLSPRDLAFVICLIFVEAGRLASATFFMRLVMRPLAYHSQDPRRIIHSADEQYPHSHIARICSSVLQFILIAPSLVVPIMGHIFLHYSSHETSRNLQISLRIFYSLVTLNSLVALLYLICSVGAFISLNKHQEQSVLRYFDTVLERACMSTGLVQADNFNFFEFAYAMLGGELRRNVQPEAVAKNHKKMIQYMYAHRLGVDFLEIYLDAQDAFVKLVAVNMVGFWADREWGVGVQELKLSEEILTKLADKVANGQVGWAATTSFGVLAASSSKGAHIVASTCTSSKVRLPDRLAHLVDDSSSRSLSFVRTLTRFYEQLSLDALAPPQPFAHPADTTLVPKLEKLATKAKVHRLRVQAAYLLLLMDKKQLFLGENFREEVLAIDPPKEKYWFLSEVMMLKLLRSYIPDVPPLKLPQEFKIHKDLKITPPPWAYPTSSKNVDIVVCPSEH